MRHSEWFLTYSKHLKNIAIETLTKIMESSTEELEPAPDINEIINRLFGRDILTQKQNNERINYAIREVFQDFHGKYVGTIREAFKKLSDNELSIKMQYTFYTENRWVTTSDVSSFLEQIIRNAGYMLEKVDELYFKNIYIFSALEAINKLFDHRLEDFEIGSGIKTELYKTYLRPDGDEPLNKMLNEYYRNFVSFRTACQSKEISSEMLFQTAYDSHEKLRNEEKVKRMDRELLKKFIKYFVHRLQLEGKENYSGWVDSIFRLTEYFYDEIFSTTSNFPKDFSDFIICYIINGKILESWVFRRISELVVPVVANVSFNKSVEYDFVAFIDDKFVYGDVTFSKHQNEVQDKINKLRRVSQPNELETISVIVQVVDDVREGVEYLDENVRRISLLRFDNDNFRKNFYRAIFG